MIRITTHAIERYQERIENLPAEVVIQRLSTRAIETAVHFGAHCVRLAGGQRVIIEDHAIVTILPAENYRKQIARQGLGRFGQSRRFMEDE